MPTAPPQNVTVVNKTSTSIFITWDAVPPNQRSGEILGYKVSYTFRKKTPRTRTVGAQTIYTNLTVLQKFRRYNITVMAYNQHGDGPPSKALRVRTDEDSKFWYFSCYWNHTSVEKLKMRGSIINNKGIILKIDLGIILKLSQNWAYSATTITKTYYKDFLL